MSNSSYFIDNRYLEASARRAFLSLGARDQDDLFLQYSLRGKWHAVILLLQFKSTALDVAGNNWSEHKILHLLAASPQVAPTILRDFVAGLYALPNPSLLDCYKQTPLHIAAQHNNLRLVGYLGRRAVGMTDIAGNNPLHLAALNANPRAAGLLVDALKDSEVYSFAKTLNAKNILGQTPAYFAEFQQNKETLSEITAAGGKISRPSVKTPLLAQALRKALDESLAVIPTRHTAVAAKRPTDVAAHVIDYVVHNLDLRIA